MERRLEAVLARLAGVAPDATARAALALASCLEGTRRSAWPEVAWQASQLTNTGYPVELSWSSRDRSIRWTAEVTGPETPEPQRVAAARAWVEGRGASARVLDEWTPPPASRFGAWVGGRHDAVGDRYKLYVETGDCPPAGELVAESRPARLTWRMAGFDLHAGSVELYGRLARPEAWAVEVWLARLGITAELLSPLRSLVNLPTGDRLPGALGVSVALASGVVQAAALFIHSGPLLGSDDAVRRSIHASARRHGWCTGLYDALVGDDAADRPGRHGLLGVGADRAGALFLQVGMRP